MVARIARRQGYKMAAALITVPHVLIANRLQGACSVRELCPRI